MTRRLDPVEVGSDATPLAAAAFFSLVIEVILEREVFEVNAFRSAAELVLEGTEVPLSLNPHPDDLWLCSLIDASFFIA